VTRAHGCPHSPIAQIAVSSVADCAAVSANGTSLRSCFQKTFVFWLPLRLLLGSLKYYYFLYFISSWNQAAV